MTLHSQGLSTSTRAGLDCPQAGEPRAFIAYVSNEPSGGEVRLFLLRDPLQVLSRTMRRHLEGSFGYRKGVSELSVLGSFAQIGKVCGDDRAR